jgi:hypothetical protein
LARRLLTINDYAGSRDGEQGSEQCQQLVGIDGFRCDAQIRIAGNWAIAVDVSPVMSTAFTGRAMDSRSAAIT